MDQFQSQRPYRSHKYPACDRCRKRKLRCSGGSAEQPCMLCAFHKAACEYQDRPTTATTSRSGGGGDEDSQVKRRRRTTRRKISSDSPTKRTRTSSPQPRNVKVKVKASEEEDQEYEEEEEEKEEMSFAVGAGNHDAAAAAGVAIAASVKSPPPAEEEEESFRSKGTETSIIVGPAVAEDVYIVSQHMLRRGESRVQTTQTSQRSPYNIASNQPGDTVLYLSLPKRRMGLELSADPGKRQVEILRALLGPHSNELVRLYFDHVHYSFPVLDERIAVEFYENGGLNLSPTLVCDFYAHSITLWDRSPILRRHPRPDPAFVWNLAVEAMQADFLAPGLATLYAVVLDLNGRPVYSVIGNAINSGRTVALANSLGLNRDPTLWKRSEMEKNLRIRLWWAILIHDYWSSFAHGVPPHSTQRQYNVPLPSIDNIPLGVDKSNEKRKMAECFIHLCTLTKLLGDVLPLLYDLHVDVDSLWKRLRRHEVQLDEWAACMEAYSSRTGQTGADNVPGSSSLRLGYLSIRLLLRRIALHGVMLRPESEGDDSRRYHLAMLRRAAQDIVDCICCLTRENFLEFWLPYNAHHLVTTVIILLRCIVESTDETAIQSGKHSLERFWRKLQEAARDHEWDLAEMCISRCGDMVMKILGGSIDATATVPAQPETIADPARQPQPQSQQQQAQEQQQQQQQYQQMPQMQPDLLPDILPFSNPDITFDAADFESLWYGLNDQMSMPPDGMYGTFGYS